jgi:hypothetical protein
MDTGSLSQGVRRQGGGVDHPPSASAKFKAREEICLYSPSGLSWPVIGKCLYCSNNSNNNTNNNLISMSFKGNEPEGQTRTCQFFLHIVINPYHQMILEIYVSFISHCNPELCHNCYEE